MKYFSVPICPYCKKRVNLIRTWSLKRQGEYRCPRCGGISNIYLSPLIYVFALMAVLAAGALYFFHKFVLDDIQLSTVTQVLLPFVVFFLLSLFMVYLEKPVIKKIPKVEIDRRRRAEERREARKKGTLPRQNAVRETVSRPNAAAQRSAGKASPPAQGMFYEEDEYLPKVDYRTGPLPVSTTRDLDQTSVVKVPPQTTGGTPKPMTLEQVTAPTKIAQEPKVPAPSVTRAASPRQTPAEPASAGASSGTEDFFAKYNDPEYVERRLRELNEQRERTP